MTETFSIRPPSLDDVAAILAVVHASDIAAVGEPDFTADEVITVLTGPNHDPSLDSWLAVQADGRVIGWAFIENHSGGARELIDVYVDPEVGRPAQGALLDRVLARVPQRAATFGHAEIAVRAGAIASETHWVGLLERAGFTFLKRYARMSRPLTGDEQLPQLPVGVAIRTVDSANDAELRAFFGVLKAAFADIPDSLDGDYDDFTTTIAKLPSVSWDEWFVAEVDGRIVGALQSADQGVEENEGWVKYLGVAREQRGTGLGRLLLQTAFATYAKKGRTKAGLGVDLTNPTAAYRLYEGVGLRPSYEVDTYERTLLAG